MCCVCVLVVRQCTAHAQLCFLESFTWGELLAAHHPSDTLERASTALLGRTHNAHSTLAGSEGMAAGTRCDGCSALDVSLLRSLAQWRN